MGKFTKDFIVRCINLQAYHRKELTSRNSEIADVRCKVKSTPIREKSAFALQFTVRRAWKHKTRDRFFRDPAFILSDPRHRAVTDLRQVRTWVFSGSSSFFVSSRTDCTGLCQQEMIRLVRKIEE